MLSPQDNELLYTTKPGTPTVFGTKLNHHGFAETLQALAETQRKKSQMRADIQKDGIVAQEAEQDGKYFFLIQTAVYEICRRTEIVGIHIDGRLVGQIG